MVNHEHARRVGVTGRKSASLLPIALAMCLVVASGCSDESQPIGGGNSGQGAGGQGGAGGPTGGGDAGGGGGAPIVPTVLLPRTSIQPAELAVVANDQDPQSLEVAAYYQQARGIPVQNLITLSFPTGNVLSPDDFAVAKAALDAALGPDIQALALSWTTPYRVGCMSVTSAFALGFDTKYCNTSGQGCGPTAPVAYFDSDSVRPYTDLGIRPAMVLAGVTTADVETLIDRGIAADDSFPTGDGYFIRTTDTARSVRWPDMVATVADWDHPEGLTLSYIDNSTGSGSNYLENVSNVLFYLTGLANVPSIETNDYLPGAVADHLTSYGGKIPTSGQMSIVRWLEAGATASYGTTVEPCNYPWKFPNSRVLLPRYYRGETVLEAYWKSVSWPGEGVFVGEPLARPWGSSTVQISAEGVTIITTLLDPDKTYEIGGADAPNGPFEPLLAPITVPYHQRATITVPPPFRPYLRLAIQGAP